MLWPPNHKYHAVTVCGVTDPDSGDVVTITVTSVTQDGPVNGPGDGNTCPDAQIVDGQASVRAERAGTPGVPGNGRVYQINFTSSDGADSCSGSVSVCVPHDQSDPTCVDDGQRYNWLGPYTGGNGLAARDGGERRSVSGHVSAVVEHGQRVERRLFRAPAGGRCDADEDGAQGPLVAYRSSGVNAGVGFGRRPLVRPRGIEVISRRGSEARCAATRANSGSMNARPGPNLQRSR